MSDHATEAAALLEQAHELARLGEGQEAMARVQAAHAKLPEDTAPHLRAEVELAQAGIELRLLGLFENALDTARRAAQRFQQAHEANGECRALATQAIAASRLGYYETALDCALMAVKLSTRSEAPDARRLPGGVCGDVRWPQLRGRRSGIPAGHRDRRAMHVTAGHLRAA